MLLDQRVAGTIQLRFYAIWRATRALRRAVRRIHAEVYDRNTSARFERAVQRAEVAIAILDVMERVYDKDKVRLFGQKWIAWCASHGNEVFQSITFCSLGKVLYHVGFDVHTVDPALWNHMG